MLARIGHVLLIAALLAATGTHWALLQSIAWTTMFAENLRSTPLKEAVERTFDGKHPCSLCKQIAAGKRSEQKTNLAPSQPRLEFVNDTARFDCFPPAQFRFRASLNEHSDARPHAPPTPPPRVLPA